MIELRFKFLKLKNFVYKAFGFASISRWIKGLFRFILATPLKIISTALSANYLPFNSGSGPFKNDTYLLLGISLAI
jgi:hypothetical protein